MSYSNNRDFQIPKEDIKEWITNGISRPCINYTEALGEYLCDLKGYRNNDALSTSQIRNYFGEVKRIQLLDNDENRRSSFLLIKPKIAYATARVIQRNRNSRITTFKSVIDVAHESVETEINKKLNEKHFQNFVDFLESILAFHKAYGGRD
ncbi:MAG: type III-A CRISPR-associated protein Csm2 [Saprospiraceae bacterium]